MRPILPIFLGLALGLVNHYEKPAELQAASQAEGVEKGNLDFEIKKKSLDKLEKTVTHNLMIWSHYETALLMKLGLVSENKDESIQARQAAFNIIKASQLLGTKIENIAGSNLTIDDIEAVNLTIDRTERGAKYLTPFLTLSEEEIRKKAEKKLSVQEGIPKEEIESRAKDLITSLKSYKNIVKFVAPQRDSLIKGVEQYNADAKKAGVPEYQPPRRMTLQRLKSLQSIK